MVTEVEVAALATLVGAASVIETSAKTGAHIDEAFVLATRAAKKAVASRGRSAKRWKACAVA